MEPSTPEIRTDVLTGMKVIVAPARSLRPSARHPEPPLSRSNDPFAEGNEAETPQERFAIRRDGSIPNGPGWQLRVVPNRYPAFLPNPSVVPPVSLSGGEPACRDITTEDTIEDTGVSSSNLFPSEPAFGEHDVVIECPDSRTRLAELSTHEVQRIFSAWRTRVQHLSEARKFSSVAVFRNEGFSAGASLAHCHSQIIASEQPSPLDLERDRRSRRYLKETARELMLDLLNAERADGRRIICETSGFAVFCPWAPRTSWHVRFVPLQDRHRSFTSVTDDVLLELAGLLKGILEKLELALGGPFSFNITLPHPLLDYPPHFRWMMDLLPRTSRAAGWEFLSGVDIVSVPPEYSAEMLR